MSATGLLYEAAGRPPMAGEKSMKLPQVSESERIAAEGYERVDPFLEQNVGELQRRLSIAQAKVAVQEWQFVYVQNMLRAFVESGATVDAGVLHKLGLL